MRKFYTAVLLITISLIFSSCNQQIKKVKAKETQTIAEPVAETKEATYTSKYDTRKALEGKFAKQKNGNLEQVMPKTVGQEGNGIYCYFFIRGKKAISLKLHIQFPEYDADLYELEVDREVKAYEANKDHMSSGGALQVAGESTIKWYDKTINEEDEALLRKIGEAEQATLRLKSKKSSSTLETISLTKAQRESLINTIDYYKSLDGAKIPKKGMVNIRG